MVNITHIMTLLTCEHDREGNVPDIVACGSLYEFLCKIHEQYGPVASFWLGPTLCISVGSANLFREQANAFDQACKFIVYIFLTKKLYTFSANISCCLLLFNCIFSHYAGCHVSLSEIFIFSISTSKPTDDK